MHLFWNYRTDKVPDINGIQGDYFAISGRGMGTTTQFRLRKGDYITFYSPLKKVSGVLKPIRIGEDGRILSYTRVFTSDIGEILSAAEYLKKYYNSMQEK